MPQPGEVYHYPDYVFPDGDQKDKFVVLLGQLPGGDWIVGRTTSRSHGRPRNPRCSHSDPYPSFFLDTAGGLLRVESWVVLNRLDDHDDQTLGGKIARAEISRIGELPLDLFCLLLSCAFGADDTTHAQARALADLRAALHCP